MDVLTLTIALVGLVLSALSFGWQIIQYLLSAGRVKVQRAWGYVPDYGMQQFFCITAVNVGRAPTTVQAVGLMAATGETVFSTRRIPGQPQLPARLEVGQELGFMLETDGVNETCAREGLNVRALRPFVRLPGGKVIKGDRYNYGRSG